MTQQELNQLAIEIYRSFTEAEGGLNNHPLQLAWDYCRELHGEIEVSSPIDCLFMEAIKYTLEQTQENRHETDND